MGTVAKGVRSLKEALVDELVGKVEKLEGELEIRDEISYVDFGGAEMLPVKFV